MRPISRRRALLLGGLGAAGTVAGGTGLVWSLSSRPGPTTGSSLVQPQELRSDILAFYHNLVVPISTQTDGHECRRLLQDSISCNLWIRTFAIP